MTLRIPVEGMTCEACESAISRALLRIDGVTKATASHKAKSVDVAFDGNKVKAAQLKKAIDDLGYTAILPGH